jgi:hypothetical protein
MARFKDFESLVNHVKTVNPQGRGRAYDIASLVQLAEKRARRPLKIRDRMRVILADLLAAAGISHDNILDEKKYATRLWSA